jgi:hypothetical protein
MKQPAPTLLAGPPPLDRFFDDAFDKLRIDALPRWHAPTNLEHYPVHCGV